MKKGRYAISYVQEILVQNKKEHKDYFDNLLINIKEKNITYINSNSAYIDNIIVINNIVFVFRLTTSKFQVEISNSAKWWKVRSDLSDSTIRPRTKKNPLQYVPSSFLKLNIQELKDLDVYYIFAVKNPYNKSLYENNYFIGSYNDSFNFIKGKLK